MEGKTEYTNLREINDTQTRIMQFVDLWVHDKKTTVPLRWIIVQMEKAGTKDQTTIKAVRVLLKKGYIRRSAMISNKTYFVQLRRV